MLRFIGAITFAFVFFSCSNKSDSILAVFKATEEGLTQSNFAIASANKEIYNAINDKLTDVSTVERGLIWQPKALLIKDISGSIKIYIDSLIKALKNEAGIKMENEKMVFHEDNIDAVKRLFIEKNKGSELFKKLTKYTEDMLAVDPEIKKQFGEQIKFKFEVDKKNDFTEKYFKHTPAIAALAMLRRFENSIVVMENNFTRFCLEKTSFSGCNFGRRIQAIVSQNSEYLKAGDEIEITAGIGTFYDAAKPKITIGNKVFESDAIDGFAKYKFKTQLKAGKYSLPVKIEFIDADGTKKIVPMKVDYTILE
ncbi:hypothetical protein [Ferruginibacter sp.]